MKNIKSRKERVRLRVFENENAHFYSGLGQRIGRERREGDRILKDRYLLDQTRPYHNLLGIEREGDVQTFYYDGNVAAMEDGKNGFHYYLQDELGSPLRVSGYERKEGTESEGGSYAAPDYLTYGYDEFGNDLYRELEESGIPSPYDKQGEEQPFGYTGYRYDEISGTYFAQAREYQPENGRFTAEDVVKGNGAVPETLNRYGYCWNNPMIFVDKNGLSPEDGQNDTYVYDRDAAIEYAKKWSTPFQGLCYPLEVILGKIGMIENYEYYSYTTNCANFVSQCLYAGGIQENEQWHSYRHTVTWESGSGNHFADHYEWENTESWRLAAKQFDYFSDPNNGYINGEVITITTEEEMSIVLETENIQKGDLMYFLDEDGNVHHATIINSVDEGGIYFSGNTKRRFNKPLGEALDSEPGVYIIKLNDELPVEGECIDG